MTALPAGWREGEIAIIGLAKSGTGAAALLAREGARVYASDSGEPETLGATAAELRILGVDVETGGHDLERIARAKLVVASPGVPPGAPPLAAARDAGVPVVSEIEVALRLLGNTRIIAVTGTNGKTTTTALVGHLLRSIGVTAIDAGNIGTPLSQVALNEHPSWIALEMSSFQLHDTPGLDPTVGVVTNLSPDHLDRYAGVDDYYADKAMLFRNASSASRWVLNADDDEVLNLAVRGAATSGYRPYTQPTLGKTHLFSLGNRDCEAYYDRNREALVVLGDVLLDRKDLALFGDHNVANALAASLAVMIADPDYAAVEARERIAGGLRSFRALKHRLEVAGEYDGVLWINDSKATNVSSTLVAVQGMTRPTILLLGGRHKGEPYTALAEPFGRVGKRVIAYGEAAPIIESDLGSLISVERLGSSFPDVIARASEIAESGDAILLSPACSSYDMFRNYEERGADFKRLATGKA